MRTLSILTILAALLMVNCEKESIDPCAGVSCSDNGTCVDGSCECDFGYSGPNCSTALIPSRLIFSSFTVTDWPAVNENGEEWDARNAPDPYLAFINQTTGRVVYLSTPVMDATPPLILSDTIIIEQPSEPHSIYLFDRDDMDGNDMDGDDYMTGADWASPAQGLVNAGFPASTEINLVNEVGFRVTFDISYEF